MAFPEKFKKLLESNLSDVEVPDYLYLTFAVCGCERDSCGWIGWMIEAVFKSETRKNSDKQDKLLDSCDEQRYPRCGKVTFRTNASVIMENSGKQIEERLDYEVSPMEFE